MSHIPLLALAGVTVRVRGLDTPVLDVPSLAIGAAATVAVSGPSGSGKTTLANVVSGLERPTTGTVVWNGRDLTALSKSKRDAWRAGTVGLVLQDFHLFPGLSALENVLLPAGLRRLSVAPELRSRAAQLLDSVGIDRHRQTVETMSRGEMQRVAVARALLQRPSLIVADEPTASLDKAKGHEVGALITELAAAAGAALIVITHDEDLARRMGRRLHMLDGRLREDAAGAGAP